MRGLVLSFCAAGAGLLVAGDLARSRERSLLAEFERTLASGDGRDDAAALADGLPAGSALRHRLLDMLFRACAGTGGTPARNWIAEPLPRDGDGTFLVGASREGVFVDVRGLAGPALRGLGLDPLQALSPPPPHGGAAFLPLPAAGTGSAATVAPRVLLAGGTGATMTVPAGMPAAIRRKSSAPRYFLETGGGRQAIEPFRVAVVPPGEAFRIVIEDPFLVVERSIELEGLFHETAPVPQPVETVLLDPAATMPALGRERLRIPVRLGAVNGLGNASRIDFQLLIRCHGWNPVLAVEVAGRVLEEGAGPPVAIPAGLQEFRALLAPDAAPEEIRGLALFLGGEALPAPVEVDGTLRAAVPVPADGSADLILRRHGRTLARYAFAGDGAGPRVSLTLEDGREVGPGPAAIAACGELLLRIEDPSGLTLADQVMDTSLIAGEPQARGPSLIEWRIRMPSTGSGDLLVQARDALGNPSGESVWNLRVAEPARVTGWRVAGKDPARGDIAVRRKEITVALDSAGDGDVVLSVEDPANERVLSALPWRRFAGDRGVFSLSLEVEAGQDQDRLLRVRNPEGEILDAIPVRVDRAPPSVSVPGQDSSGVLVMPSGQTSWRVVAQDQRQPPVLAATGAVVLDAMETGPGVREYRLATPEALPAIVHLEVRDDAGNRAVAAVQLRRP